MVLPLGQLAGHRLVQPVQLHDQQHVPDHRHERDQPEVLGLVRVEDGARGGEVGEGGEVEDLLGPQLAVDVA